MCLCVPCDLYGEQPESLYAAVTIMEVLSAL